MKCKYGLLLLSLLAGCRAIPEVREHSFGGNFNRRQEVLTLNYVYQNIDFAKTELRESINNPVDTFQKELPKWKVLQNLRVDSIYPVQPAVWAEKKYFKANLFIEKAENLKKQKNAHWYFKMFPFLILLLLIVLWGLATGGWSIISIFALSNFTYLFIVNRSLERFYRRLAVRKIKQAAKFSPKNAKFEYQIRSLWMLRYYYTPGQLRRKVKRLEKRKPKEYFELWTKKLQLLSDLADERINMELKFGNVINFETIFKIVFGFVEWIFFMILIWTPLEKYIRNR